MSKSQPLQNRNHSSKLTADIPLFKAAKVKLPRPTFEQRFHAKVLKAGPKDCWHWQGAPDTCSLGYGRIQRDGEKLYAHRVAYELANGSVPARAYVRHTCDNPICCNPAHLIAGIPADNVADMVAKGRGRGKLLKSEVLEIDRLDREEGTYWTHKRLANRFKITETSIRRLLSGATWSTTTGRKTAGAKAVKILKGDVVPKGGAYA